MRKTLGCLSVGVLCVRAALTVTWIVTGAGPAGLLTAGWGAIVYYPPALAIIAVFAQHFRPAHAVWAGLASILLEISGFIPAYDPLSLLATAFSWVWPGVAPDVLGKSLLVLLGALAVGLSLIHKITIFRLVAAVLAFAQCLTLVLFHFVAFTWPLGGIEAREAAMVVSTHAAQGSIEPLCKFEGRFCVEGPIAGLAEATVGALASADRLSLFLSDTRERDRVVFTWIENPMSGSLDRVHLVSVQKTQADRALVVVNSDGPSLVYDANRLGGGVLIAVFHQAWITLALLIAARHGAYVYRAGGWRLDRLPTRP